ncbi:MAG TPA: hypothetical protein VF169_10950 [Albitalea sp.]|uniref:hypothetical protein n=1 Tax=Piscinibacter sp. TaxID=1903157 RepID=UPI002ED0B480
MTDTVLRGNWTYRSFVNNVAPVGDDPQRALSLIFGEGEWRFVSGDDSSFKAVLDFGGGAAMDLFGTVVASVGVGPQVLQITGTGREGTSTAKWVYQYLGYAVPDWPEGVDQVPAIVGTVIRTIPHGTGQAGVVASFVALKHA